MIVRDQQQVHTRQRIQTLPWSAHPPRTGEPDWAAPLGPYRIEQHADAADLHQKRRVTDESHRDLVVRGSRWTRLNRIFNSPRPWLPLPFATPTADVIGGLALWGVRVEEPLAVEV